MQLPVNMRDVTDNKNFFTENKNVSRNGDSPPTKQKSTLDNKVTETSHDFLVNIVPNFKIYPK